MYLYKKLSDNKIQCTACKWYCVIPEGFVGVCSVRANVGGKLKLLVENYAAAYHIDPIEKKPFYHFFPGTRIFSLGTFGCNFGCEFCQNWDISQTPKFVKTESIRAKKTPIEGIEKFIKKHSVYLPAEKIVELTLKYNLPSIAFTYNEPTIFAEYAYKTMKIAKKHGLFGVFVSSGYESKETLDLMEGYIDAYNIDLKGATEEFYQKVVHTKLKNVLETIEEIYKHGKWIEITTLVIPGYNDSEKDLRFIAKFIAGLSKDIPWHITAFYPAYKFTDVPPTSFSSLEKAYEIGKEEGLNYVYTGNIPNKDTESTYCPKCGNILIERFGYSVKVKGLDLETGKCKNCGLKIPGVWKA